MSHPCTLLPHVHPTNLVPLTDACILISRDLVTPVPHIDQSTFMPYTCPCAFTPHIHEQLYTPYDARLVHLYTFDTYASHRNSTIMPHTGLCTLVPHTDPINPHSSHRINCICELPFHTRLYISFALVKISIADSQCWVRWLTLLSKRIMSKDGAIILSGVSEIIVYSII